jgi:hypothetical protein
VAAWIDQYRKFWSARLDALDKYLTKAQGKPAKKKRRSG